MIRRILHPSDFSPASRAAFTRALALAKENRAQLVITHVIAPIVPMGDGYMSPQVYEEVDAASRKYGQKHLGTLVAQAKRAGVRATSVLLEGNAADRIVRAARSKRADMIVMGTHGRTGLARLLLGSVASRVVGQAGCPVMTVRRK
jgi:nucleotide-binding universal stress UspA family protein